MADREVTSTKKDSDGDILALCNPREWWSPREKEDAINDINTGEHTYYVKLPDIDRVDIKVVENLRTDPDQTTENNLDNLPDCD